MNTGETIAPQEQALPGSEAEALLAQGTQEQAAVLASEPPERAPTPAAVATPYEFHEPALLASRELRQLRMRHEEFARSVATRLSIYLRLEFSFHVRELQTTSYRKFLETKPNPTHLTLFQIESLEGIGLLEIPPRLGIAIVDRQLGGAGSVVDLKRDLSEIEMALLDQAVQLILQEWCQLVADLPQGHPAVFGHETHARFLQTCPLDTPMLLISLEARLGDCVEGVDLALPYPMVEPVLRKLFPVAEPNPREAAPPPQALQWKSELDEVKVALDAGWNGLCITARELAHLKVGDVLPVAPHHLNNVQVRLARISKFIGRLGRKGNAWAVELTGSVRS